MSKLNATDIQGFVLRGYNFPLARHLFLRITGPESGRALVDALLPLITTGQRWDQGAKPLSTVNIGFTHKGLAALDLPLATLISFPVEFQQGMRSRAEILGDRGRNAPENWDALWRDNEVHVWLGVNAQTAPAMESACSRLQELVEQSGGAVLLGSQDAGMLIIDGQPTTREHFGFTDGFGNPDYLGVERTSQPGQGKLMPDGSWAPLATGELLLGYADEAGELPVAPIPHLLASNGTFMIFRKLHQNVATYRAYLEEWGARYSGGKQKLASKLIGRWQDGTPVELSPERPDPSLVKDQTRNTNFTFSEDAAGARCPIGAHVRRVNPRDAFGFKGRLINRRRITRRGLPYGPYVPEDQPVSDAAEHGVAMMVLNASISRQFEFVQQQWIEYGNDAHLGNDKDPLMGNHGGEGRFLVQGDTTASNPPFVCSNLPSFVELRGGDYFFLPSITALGMIALELVDPR
ncbi:MAG TPA: dyp-type peroxidase [Acidisarcina sp.]